MVIKRMVIDVLLPHQPDILTYAEKIGELEGTAGVSVNVLEQDDKTRTVEMTIEGESLPFEQIKQVIEDLGGSVHSIDQVSAGSKIVEPKAR